MACMIIKAALAAHGQGIRFETNTTWAEVLAKAKAEHKYIFVDCYATWCGPCKQMDQNIYPLKEVGDIYNKQFVCVKLQTDTTKNDNEEIRSWYATARAISRTYGINSLPAFLFFDPDGKPEHKVSGTLDVKGFIQLAANAQNPEKQYYHILHDFKPGKLDTVEEKGLIAAFRFSDKVLAGKMAADYLNRIPKSQIGSDNSKNIMNAFKDDPQVLRVALTYINSFGKNSFLKGENARFIEDLSEKQPEVQQISINYIIGLKDSEWFIPENVAFISWFMKYPKVAEIAKGFILRLPEDELSKPDLKPIIKGMMWDPKIQEITWNFINKQPENKLYTKDIISFIGMLTGKPSDPGFNFFFKNADKIDRAMDDRGYAQQKLENILIAAEEEPALKAGQASGDQFDFEQLKKDITQKYNAYYANRVDLQAKMDWYSYLIFKKKQEKNWPQLIRSCIDRVENIRMDTVPGWTKAVNTFCYSYFFTHCNNRDQLDTAVRWMKNVVRINPTMYDYMDTYAMILYKIGKKETALDLESKAKELAIAQGHNGTSEFFQRTIDRMRNNEPIWTEKEYQ